MQKFPSGSPHLFKTSPEDSNLPLLTDYARHHRSQSAFYLQWLWASASQDPLSHFPARALDPPLPCFSIQEALKWLLTRTSQYLECFCHVLTVFTSSYMRDHSGFCPLLHFSTMQIPLWAFLTSLLFALTWQDMAALLAKSTFSKSFTTAIKPLLLPSLTRIVPPVFHYTLQQSHIRSYTHTSSTMSSQQFLDIVKARRSIYTLKKESTIDDEKIQDIITQSLLHVPSSFNSQSTRIVLLLKEEHNKLWDIIKSTLQAAVSKEQWPTTEKKLNGLHAGYGTVSNPTSI